MRDVTEVTAHALAQDTSREYAVALFLSRLFHPMLLGIASFFLIGLAGTDAWLSGLAWAAFGILVMVVPPTLFFVWRLRQGAYSDEDVSNRTQRYELYAFSLANLLVGAGLLWLLNAPPAFLALLASGAAVTLIAALVNLFWKISVHGSSAASFATLALLYTPVFGVLAWLAALAVGWARVRTGNHTALQVLAGFVLAATSVVLMFRLFALP
ncbi:MAG: phosphatase PAP2 family protein [Chloroflexaceae bacterium]|nr:phosphatase PAP2 family protein [Chloroflexaceae bacterium]